MRRFRLLLLVCAAAVVIGSGAATAAVSNPVAQDCLTHGKLTHHYTVAQLRAGLNSLPTSGQEYGDCGALISNAIYAEIGGKGGHIDKTSGGGSSTGIVVVIAIVVVLVVLAGGGLALSSARKRASSD